MTRLIDNGLLAKPTLLGKIFQASSSQIPWLLTLLLLGCPLFDRHNLHID